MDERGLYYEARKVHVGRGGGLRLEQRERDGEAVQLQGVARIGVLQHTRHVPKDLWHQWPDNLSHIK